MDLAIMEKFFIFRNMTDEQMKQMAEFCEEVEYDKGDCIFKEGSDADYMWLLLDGEVQLRFDLPGQETSEDHTVTTIKAGLCFGWSSLVEPFKYTLSAYCVSRRCNIAKADKTKLLKLFDKDPAIGYIFMRNLINVTAVRYHKLLSAVAEKMGHDIMNKW